jgi:hypothetical protein
MGKRLLVLLGLLSSCSASPRFHERILASIAPGDEFVGPAYFSRDGRKVAYRVKTVDGWQAVLGTWRSNRLDFL